MGTGALDDLIRRARRRYLGNLVLRVGVRAGSAALAGLIVLLLLGTEVLNWPWVAALAVVAALAGLWTLPRQIPSSYRIARLVDRCLDLHDSLSTAIFYKNTGAPRANPEIREAQFSEAERLAQGIDVRRAVPLRAPRSIYAMGVLALVASSLFALRYAIEHRLDLRPPLTTLVFDAFHFASEPAAVAKHKREIRHADDKLKQSGQPENEDAQRTAGAPGASPGLSAEAPDSERPKNSQADASKQRASASFENMNRREQSGDDAAEGSGEGTSESQNGSERDAEGQRTSRGNPAGSNGASQQAASSQHENNGLLDRFKDAMSNLLSKLKSQPRQEESQQRASNSNNRQNQPGRRQQGQQAQERSGRRSEGAPNGDSEGDEQGDSSQKAESGPGKQGGSDAEQAARQGQSGIGKDDGSKAIRDAEQLAAMGKISEILGKRSESLTGDVMVEVASGKQELRTGYTQQSSKHADAGTEIHRDEIPLAYERYVQQYFEEIRKAAPKKATPAPAK